MKRKNKKSKIFPFILAASLFCTQLSIVASASGIGTELYRTDLQVADNATFSTVVASHPENGREQSFFMEYSPGGSVSPVVAYGSKLYGRSDIDYVTSYLEKEGKSVVGGLNADFFVMSTGIPIGIVVTDGILKSSDSWQNAIGFFEDGSAMLGRPELYMSLQRSNGKTIPITYFNKVRTTAGVYLLNQDFSSSTQISTKGKNVVLKNVDSTPFTVGMEATVVVESITSTSSSTQIADGTMVLTVDDKGPLSTIPSDLKVGETLKLHINSADARWSQVKYAVGGGDFIIKNGSAASKLETNLNPRSAVGIKDDGSVVMYAVDGRRPGTAGGLNQVDLANELLAMGCVEAIDMDGGGSTTMSLTYPGTTSSKIVNIPSDNAVRKCANYIMLVNYAQKTGIPSKLYLYPYDAAVLAGASVNFDIKAVDDGYYPTQVPGDVNLSVPEEYGQTNGNKFISSGFAGSTTVSAESYGITGEAKVTVYDKITSLNVKKAGESTNVTSMSLSPGQKVDLNASAFVSSRPLYSSDNLFKWNVEGGVGTITENGEFTAASVYGASGKITVSYNGTSVSIPVTTGKLPEIIESFDNVVSPKNWTVDKVNNVAPGNITTSKDYNYVKYGYGSASFSYNFTKSKDLSRITARPQTPITLSSPSYLNIWVYGDNSNNYLLLSTKNSSGTFQETTKCSLNFKGWKLVSFTLPANTICLNSVSLVKNTAGSSSGKIYLDNLIASYKVPVTVTDPPSVQITSPENKGRFDEAPVFSAVLSGLENTGFMITSSNIKLKFDGKITSFTYNTDNKTVSSQLQDTLPPGLHTVTIDISDAFGNITKASSLFYINGDNTSEFSDMTGHWAAPYVDFLYKKGVMTGEKQSGSYLFNPERNTTRAEIAAIVARYLNLNPDDYKNVSLPFSDKSAIPSWALNYVKAVYANGIMLGRSDGSKTYFDPGASITRMETMTILGRTIPQGYKVSNVSFADSSKIPSWAAPYVKKLVSLNIVNGYSDSTIRPLNNITRSEISKILFMMY